MNRDEPIWITGVGTANPLGNDYPAVARNLLAGKSGVRPITDLKLDEQACKIAGQFGALSAPTGWDSREFAQLAKLHQLILWCTTGALQDAGYWSERAN